MRGGAWPPEAMGGGSTGGAPSQHCSDPILRNVSQLLLDVTCYMTAFTLPHNHTRRPTVYGRTTECWHAHIPIHYAGKSETEREARYAFTGWSAQRDRHGAFKLKPSVARFQLVLV